ncbi:MAG: histidine kinase [Verrucomicrobiae bacterium]|nr:histidine kinase [Verrucomicrobiae bacterium]
MNTASTNRRMIWRLAPLWVALCLWSALIILFTFTAAVVNSEPWLVSLEHTCSFWLLWIFFFPIIIWLSLRFPLEQPRLFPQIGIHLAACLSIVIVIQAAYRTFLPFPSPPTPPPDEQPSFPDHRVPPDAQRPPRPMGSPGMRVAPDVLIYLMAMSACVAFAHFRKSQERERRAIELEASLAQAKLQALRMQINPHFLFNTLNAISTLVHTSPQTADEMITDLSELFRASLESSGEHEISLACELELLQRYLAIEQRRFGQRLKVEQSIDPDVLQARVPTLILQPLVENAIRHGIERQADVGIIAIQAAREGGQIKLSVSDNGKKPFHAAVLADNRQGIGLANTRARLQQLYGGEQSFTVGNGDLGGWTVEIKLPFNPAPITKAAA